VGAKQLAMAALVLGAALVADHGRAIDAHGTACAVLAAALQSALGMPLLYLGFDAVGLARGAAIDTLRPVVVLLIALSLGAPAPPPWCLGGAALVLLGALALALRPLRPASTAPTRGSP
jgi:drug/metabolite transporter (DMT)-like permease